ncbi:AMP-binding protein [Gordonia desulfuricans]|uniref:Long-chain-fatty-acid--CoA ligase n=1 Tax=Gordonia desulfuricans TaxID=89051 RepID=A0A7K3LQ64_9ACTN|nr:MULTISPECIES: AMP-binding protein [Gordonia]NDK90316.1 AMP-binding protein [Gordonia desulfuricans]WLP89576.1 AMP-binding protein [Gordonia sp. NB41Y]
MSVTLDASALGALGADLVSADPDAVAVYDVVDGRPVPVTRGRLAHRAEVLAQELRAVGVRRGHCVAVLIPNWSDALVWQFAAAALGAHVIGINTRYNVGEVRHILVAARPVVVGLATDFHGLDLTGILVDAAASAEVTPPIVAAVAGPGAAGDPVPAPDLGSGTWIAGHGGTEGLRVPDVGDVAVLTAAGIDDRADDALAVAFTTSGSTGTPKLAAHRDSAVVDHARADAAVMGIGPGDVVLCVLPVSGVFGFSTALAGLAGGAGLLMEPVFDAAGTLARMARLGVTHAVGGDDLFGRLYDTWHGGERADLSALRWIGIADFLGRSQAIADWARTEFGTHTTGVFGSSEVFALALLWADTDPEALRWNGGGRPVSDAVQVRIADPFDHTEVDTGVQGELQFRGTNVVDAYLGNAAAAQDSFTADGWFRSGDLGVATGDGGYTYVCRMGDALRLRGFLVDPAEIEHRLAEHPAVATAKVVGTTADDGHTVAVGFVVLDEVAVSGGTAEPVDAAVLKDWCRTSLAAFKVPTTVHVIEAMPTTVGGNGSKIKAAELRVWAQRWADSERDHRRV